MSSLTLYINFICNFYICCFIAPEVDNLGGLVILVIWSRLIWKWQYFYLRSEICCHYGSRRHRSISYKKSLLRVHCELWLRARSISDWQWFQFRVTGVTNLCWGRYYNVVISALASINVVNRHWARLLFGCVTAWGLQINGVNGYVTCGLTATTAISLRPPHS